MANDPENGKSTRLIVKNLPKHLNEKRLTTIFSKHGAVTDAKIIKRNKKSRLFGFIGYKDIETATEAKNYFDKTYIDTSKILVEFALKPSDCSVAWSKYSSNTKNKRSKNFKITKKQKTTKSEDEHKIVEKSEDEEFNQFLEVMRPKTSLKQFVKGEKEQPLSKIDKTSPKNDPENDKNLSLKSTRKKRIFVLNIPYSATEKEIADFFSVYGNIEEVHLPQDMLNRSKGFCFVRFVDTNSVQKILTEQKVIFQGRLLRIKVAANNPNENFDMDDKNYKKTKMRKIRKDYQKAPKNYWNNLFLRSDTIADVVAKEKNISKEDLLKDDDKQSAAVKMALSETKVISETKDYLIKNGVNEDIFSLDSLSKCKRSNRCIIVKNLPFSTKNGEIEEVFTKHGAVDRILVPPSKALAIILFMDFLDAKKAYQLLAYRKFKNVPLYLEWAPENIFSSKSNVQMDKSEKATNNKNKNERISGFSGFSVQSESCTVFVKNISFHTKTEKLRKLFSTVEGFLSATVKTKKIIDEKTKKLKELSLGYGFIEFDNSENAKKAIKTLHNVKLDGHELRLSFSYSSTGLKKDTKRDDEINSKLIIKNLPFEATSNELKQLFGEFGVIKSCRLPKRTQSHRGFAFIEFASRSEALNAFEKLKNTHLYGRHLVIEWANNESQ